MATGGGDDGLFNPKTPRMIVKDDPESPLKPDTEEHVINETDGIFRSFVMNMQNSEVQNAEADDTPRFSELSFGPQNPLSNAATVGRRLAQIGDSINAHYNSEFNSMIKILNPSPDTAFEAFLRVTERLFRDGQIHWGRIITLLCFGYRLAVTVIKRGIRGFFGNIISFIIEFLVTKGIARWIASQGGWRAVLNLVPEAVGWFGFCLVVSAAVTAIAFLYISKK